MEQSNPTKVLFATFDVIPEPTGTSVRSAALLRSIGNRFETDALTAKTPDHGHIDRFHGARLLRVPVGSSDVRSRAQAFDRAMRRQLQSEEYDVVHFTDPFGGYALCELRPSYGYKLIYDVRGFPSMELRYTDPEVESDRKFLTKLRRQEIFCLMNADLVLAPCRVALNHIVSLGVPEDKILLLPPAVDLDAFSTSEPDDDEACRLLYLGSHASWQGLPSLLFSLRQIAEKSRFQARIVGPSHGSWRQQLSSMVREFELRDMVKIEEAVPHEDVPELIAWAHVGLAPLMKVDRNTVQGSAPLKIAEYLVGGRPVITTDLPMCNDIIEHEVNGLLYPATDEDALASCLARICADKKLRLEMGAEARTRGTARFDHRSYASRLLKIYQGLVSPSVILSEDSRFEPTPTGKSSPTEQTVTLPVDIPPETPPPTSASLRDPPTQTEGLKEKEEPPVHQEEDTGSLCLTEMPWSERVEKGTGPQKLLQAHAGDSKDTDPKAGLEEREQPTPVKPQAMGLAGEPRQDEPKAQDETPAPVYAEDTSPTPTPERKPNQDASPPMEYTPPWLKEPKDDEAKPSAVPTGPSAPRSKGESNELTEAQAATSGGAHSAPADPSSIPKSAPIQSAKERGKPAERPASSKEQVVGSSTASPLDERSKGIEPAKDGSTGAFGEKASKDPKEDEPVEIDPDEAILLDTFEPCEKNREEAPGTANEQPQKDREDPGKPSNEKQDKEAGIEIAPAPSPRAPMNPKPDEALSPSKPESKPKSSGKRLGEEDTSPGFKS